MDLMKLLFCIYEIILLDKVTRIAKIERIARSRVENIVRASVCLIAIRAVLEKICKERGSRKKNLEAMLKEMVNKNIFPETLDQCSFLIRKLGNSGAHGDDIDMSQNDVLELIDFIETILYYIYELPVKIANVNDKHNLKLENKVEQGEKTLECE